MAVQLECREREVVARLSGELDHHTAGPLREQIDAAVERLHPKRLCIDFRDVTFMDSSGVGLVMGRYRLMRLTGGSLLVSGANDRVRQMMRMAGLDSLDIWGKEERNYASKSGK
ncbi:MAG: STAS domain-containing protein [Ruminococcaceae bacterium]|nr:STAS domain-containing protein [Oscillospiraceae bacterium]